MNTPWDFAICHKGDNFCDFLFAFQHAGPYHKGIYAERKEFLILSF